MSPIGAFLDTAALARLHFYALEPEQQAEAIRRQALAGHGEHTIARSTGLSVEFIRQVLQTLCDVMGGTL